MASCGVVRIAVLVIVGIVVDPLGVQRVGHIGHGNAQFGQPNLSEIITDKYDVIERYLKVKSEGTLDQLRSKYY